MDNQHLKISGYRELSQEEIDLMNEIKNLGLKFDRLSLKVMEHVADQFEAAASDAHHLDGAAKQAADDELARLASANPDNWILDARRRMQIALMELVRAVAQPGHF